MGGQLRVEAQRGGEAGQRLRQRLLGCCYGGQRRGQKVQNLRYRRNLLGERRQLAVWERGRMRYFA